MSTKSLAAALALGAAVFGATPAQAQMAEPGEEKTITAQVVDMSCYLKGEMRGADHKGCTEMCAKAGVPLVFLGEDGQIYLPVGRGMPGTGQNETLLVHAEAKVEVTGNVVERAGARTITVDKIEAIG